MPGRAQRPLAGDIDQIHPGQAVFLRLSALNRRTTPEVAGRVIGIAAELSEDTRSSASFYGVTVQPEAGEATDPFARAFRAG